MHILHIKPYQLAGGKLLCHQELGQDGNAKAVLRRVNQRLRIDAGPCRLADESVQHKRAVKNVADRAALFAQQQRFAGKGARR